MYVPKHFAETDVARLHALMRAHTFATLVSTIDGAPFATHVPLLLDAERGLLGTLVGHVARANPHWQAFDGSRPALAIFHGPHAYVSPRWFASTPNVPSWNYEVVHASGTPQRQGDPAAVRALLERSAAVFEAGAVEPWTLASVTADYVTGMQRGIVAFEIPIERLEGKRKLSQNKAVTDRAGIAAGLRAEGRADEIAIAAAMELLP
jgi:transcriptional regulator